jgi:hypothetical protein
LEEEAQCKEEYVSMIVKILVESMAQFQVKNDLKMLCRPLVQDSAPKEQKINLRQALK